MFGAIGMPELLILLTLGLFWLIPLAAVVWALITLQRIRAGQEATVARLEAIERLLAGNRPPG